MKKYAKISFEPTMGINERRAIASATEKNAIRIGNKRLAWVPVELMKLQPYQRERQKTCNQIAEYWDDSKCNVLLVSYDPQNGWFNILDGQHRAAAAKMRGVEYLVCEIFTGMNISDEAKLFVDQNQSSKKLNPFDTYKANLFIDEENDTALSRLDKRIAKVCEEYGVTVRKSQACGTLKTVPHARKIMNSEGEPCLRFIFDVVQASHWDKFKDGYCYMVMESLRKCYNANIADLDNTKKKLCGFLIKSSPLEIDSIGNREYSNLGRTARWEAVLTQIVS